MFLEKEQRNKIKKIEEKNLELIKKMREDQIKITKRQYISNRYQEKEKKHIKKII